MATTGRPLDESTATLVSPDEHHAKNLLNTPSKSSTGVSSGTVSTEEPSTPELPAGEFTAPVSIKCGWPNNEDGTEEQSPVPDVKTLATAGPEGQPPWGSQGLAAAGQKAQAAPADANSGWPHLDKEQPGTKDANSGWPKVDQEHPGVKDANSGWPKVAGSKASVTEGPEGQPPWGSQKLAVAREVNITDNASASSTAQRGGPVPEPGDPSLPDPSKPHALEQQTSNGTNNTGNEAASEDESGSVSVQCGWPNDTPKPAPTVPERSDPGTFGPRGQPPWGTQRLAMSARPEGQPPWGISNLAEANASKATETPEGQPPWGIKNLAAANPDKPADA